MAEPWEELLDQAGMTLRAWLPVSDFVPRPDDLLEGAQSAWLIGSPGQALWKAFQEHVEAHPGWEERDDPLEDFVEQIITSAQMAWEKSWGMTQIYFPSLPIEHGGRRGYLDFLALAERVGWGKMGRVALAVHPIHGMWFGLRAVVVTTMRPAHFATPTTTSVCLSCDAPCVEACPAGAVMDYFDGDDCASYRLAGHDCQEVCHARMACPVGEMSRYGPAQRAFHMGASLAMLRRWRK